MKRILLIVLFVSGYTAFAQDDLNTLATRLTLHCKTDKEKVTNIFHWITDNISYTTFSRNKRSKTKFIDYEDEEGPLKPLNERVADVVIKRKMAFCDGYARLFSALCDKAGIRSEIICGYTSGTINRSKFGVNHYWNAVYLDNKWQLLDATWASGYIDMRSNEFVRNYNGRYFLSSPEQFIRDHYPDDPRWTLLDDTKIPDEFRSSPFRQRSFNKYSFSSFWPDKGIIEASIGDTIVLEIQPSRDGVGTISPSTLTDSSLFTHSDTWVFLKPDGTSQTAAFQTPKRYTFTASSPRQQWLYLLYNDDLVLRYRLKIQDKKSQVPGN